MHISVCPFGLFPRGYRLWWGDWTREKTTWNTTNLTNMELEQYELYSHAYSIPFRAANTDVSFMR